MEASAKGGLSASTPAVPRETRHAQRDGAIKGVRSHGEHAL